MWGSASVVASLGPITVPGRTELVAAVGHLAEFSAMTRVGWLQVHAGRRWQEAVDLDAFAESSVRTLPPIPGEDPAAMVVRVLGLGRGDLPFTLYVGDDTAHLNIAHACADGYSMTRMLAAILETARTGSVPAWTTHHPVHFGATRATVSFFGKNRSQARALLGGARQRSAGQPIPPRLRQRTAWRPSVACRFRASTLQVFADLKAWRKEHASGISTVPLTIAATELALRRLGIHTTGQPLVVFDARRYLRDAGADISGNFCAGLRMRVTDSGDPLALDREIRSSVALGRPLAVLATGAARSYLRNGESASAADSGEKAWDMAYTHMGRPAEISRQPWLRGGPLPYYMGVLTPAGPNGVTMGFTEVGNHINAFASFHDNVVDPAVVESVVELVTTQIVSLLEEHRTQHMSSQGVST